MLACVILGCVLYCVCTFHGLACYNYSSVILLHHFKGGGGAQKHVYYENANKMKVISVLNELLKIDIYSVLMSSTILRKHIS